MKSLSHRQNCIPLLWTILPLFLYKQIKNLLHNFLLKPNSLYLFRSCGKRFYTKKGYLLTLHFVHIRVNEDFGATIQVRDGADSSSRYLFKDLFFFFFFIEWSCLKTASKKQKKELFLGGGVEFSLALKSLQRFFCVKL